jgi:hypothetical protein
MGAMTDDHHHHALFDPDDLDDFDFDFVNQWWHAVIAILSMGPAYLLFFVMSPLILGLFAVGLGYWTGWGTYRAARRLGLVTLQALRLVLEALRGLIRLVQR